MLREIRTLVGNENLTSCCSRDGCQVSLQNIPDDRVIVDVDLAFPALRISGERCDFIIFVCSEEVGVVSIPVELKSGNPDIAKAVRQLRSGARFVEMSVAANPAPICRPILIHGRSLSERERKRLNRLKVKFGNLNLTIKTARCGELGNLSVALKM